MKGPSGVTVVDARPSDAINLALLTEARVRAAADLLEAPALSDEQVDLEAYPDDARAIRAEVESLGFLFPGGGSARTPLTSCTWPAEKPRAGHR